MPATIVSLTVRSTAFRPSLATSTGPFWQMTVVVNNRGAGLNTAACLRSGVDFVRKDMFMRIVRLSCEKRGL